MFYAKKLDGTKDSVDPSVYLACSRSAVSFSKPKPFVGHRGGGENFPRSLPRSLPEEVCLMVVCFGLWSLVASCSRQFLSLVPSQHSLNGMIFVFSVTRGMSSTTRGTKLIFICVAARTTGDVGQMIDG